jgi:hypothetical protein
MTDRRMFRYTVPVDDKPHEFALTGDPVAVAAPQLELVEFWAEFGIDVWPTDRLFQVFGTGHPLPDGAVWVGTCPRIHGLVWHLYELTVPEDSR